MTDFRDREAELTRALNSVGAGLAGAISLLEGAGQAAKKAAPSDAMFDQMVADYKVRLERARKVVAND